MIASKQQYSGSSHKKNSSLSYNKEDNRLYKKEPYAIKRMTPSSRITSPFNDEIIKAFFSTYQTLNDRVVLEKGEGKKLSLKILLNNPITYEILFDGSNKKNTPFIGFGFPKRHEVYLNQRVKAIFPQSVIEDEKDYIEDFQDCYCCEYNYEKDSMLSLKIKDNNFLQSMLSLKESIHKDHKILFMVEMLPISDMWKDFHDEKWSKARQGKDVATKTPLIAKGFDLGYGLMEEALSVVDSLVGQEPPKREYQRDKEKSEGAKNMSEYSSASRTKKLQSGFAVRIRAFFKCSSKLAARSYATAIDTSMRELEETKGNRLVMSRVRKGSATRGLSAKLCLPIERNIMSVQELSSIVNIPNKKTQREFKIKSINTKASEVPKEMLEGDVCIGSVTIDGKKTNVYLSRDRDLTCLPMFLVTKQGGGKTTFILNLCNDAIKAGEGVILFDYIKNCATANALLKMHPHCQKITFNDWHNLCCFAFPEIEVLPGDSKEERRTKANTLAKEVKHLLNAMADDTEKMSRIMSEYLTAACKVVFVHPKTTLLKVYQVLTIPSIREDFIEKGISEGLFSEDDFVIKKLEELDEKPSRAEGVLDRFSVILEDDVLENMLMQPYEKNVDFAKLMDQGKPIVIMMPQDIFTSTIHKDVICTYFTSRIRLAMSRRKVFDKMTHIIYDELHQIPSTLKKVSETLAEPRKFSMQYVFTMHSLSQIQDKKVKDVILGVGCNFMLLKGMSPQAFEEFKQMLNGEFEFEDLVEMDYRFGSLNLFHVNNRHQAFITEMPPALKDKNGVLYIN